MSPDARILAVDRLREHATRHWAVHPEVKALTTAIASGDTEAFARFYRAWFDAMYADAVGATGRDEAFCLDVVQDAMLRIIRRMKPMATEGDLRRWLRAVVRSCAYDRLRGESRRRRREAEAAAGRQDAGTQAAPDRADLRRRLQWLEQQLRTCDDASVRMLLMRHRFGWTLQQIGVALGIKPGAVDGRLRRLVLGFRRTAQEESDD
ncbi:MAG: RNA polymerase sigma factor [Planctomycetota bacterium]